MAKGEMGFSNTVIAGLIIVALTPPTLWAVGLLPAVWKWIAHAALVVWAVLVYPVPVPFLILAIIAVCIIALLIRWLNTRDNSSYSMPESAESKPAAPAAPSSLGAQELKVFRFLVNKDGEWINVGDLFADIGLSRLIAERALNSLLNKGLIITQTNILYGPSVRVSDRGVTYAIELGWVR